jgi:hypothetical protein
MRDTENKGNLDEETIQPKPASRAVARPVRAMIAVTVVLGSAGLGYLASRIWPLSGFPAEEVRTTSTSAAKTSEPRMPFPAVAVQETESAEPSNSPASRPLERSHSGAPANSADEPKGEPKNESAGPTQDATNGSVAVLDERTAKQSTADEERAGTPGPHASDNVRTETPRRETGSKKKRSRVTQGQSSPAATPKMATSSAASTSIRNSPVLKEFMSTPMRF